MFFRPNLVLKYIQLHNSGSLLDEMKLKMRDVQDRIHGITMSPLSLLTSLIHYIATTKNPKWRRRTSLAVVFDASGNLKRL